MFNKESATKNLRLLKITSFMSNFRAYEGVIAVFYASIAGSYTLATAVLSIMAISSSLAEVPTGAFSDKIGRKKTIILYYAVSVLALIIYYLSDNFLHLAIGSIFMGIGFAFSSGTVTAFTKECVQKSKLDFSKEHGFISALGRYSLVISGIIGAGLIYIFGIKSTILLSIIFKVFALLLSFRLTDTDNKENSDKNMLRHSIESFRVVIKNPKLLNIGLARMVSYNGGNAEFRMRPVLFEFLLWPAWAINLLGALSNLFGGVFMQISHMITKRFGSAKTLVSGEIVNRVITFLFIVFHTPLTPILLQSSASTFFGVNSIASEELLQQNLDENKRATLSSMISLVGSFFYSVFVILLGLCADYFGLIPTLALTQILLMSSAFFYHRSTKV